MKEDDEVRKNSQPQRVVPRDDDNSKYFNVEGKKRIFCISVGQFEGGLNPLPNHHTDRAMMFKTFSRLGYRPTQTTNDIVSCAQADDYMKRFVSKITKKRRNENEDLKALIIYIKTHGSQGNMKHDQAEGIFIHFSDGKKYIWHYLAPLLDLEEFKAIPKIIFLEACRGRMAEFANEEHATPAAAAFRQHSQPKTPLRKNVALFAASTEGNVALTSIDAERASYFTDSVCTSLRNHPYQDLAELRRHVMADLDGIKPLVQVSEGESRHVHLLPVLENSLDLEFKFLQ